MTTVKEYFEWKLNNSVAIEDMYPDNEIITAWERRDVLYSFIVIYQIGLSILYPDLFYRTKYQVRRSDLKKCSDLIILLKK